ncbi:spore cortex-lytic enzyme [Oceanobacillus halotolerans]|uniref:spore cortex-lytic enzyme n=1 Tax=Oceanobacillus halotolerans TaxID=2663380 RepID=UPI0013DB7C7C|nr:spore cortex-lytic enzyme [Oceanobacillus halotolerans]
MTNKKLPLLLILIICCLSIGLQETLTPKQVDAFSEQVIQKGATGEDVIELQARLQYIGFYHGPIDGVFGWGTYWALRNFQEEFELESVDGLAGEKTKEMLERATEYDEQFVKEQLEKGNRFTHYGGMDKELQTAPNRNQDKQGSNNQQDQNQQNQNQQNQNQGTETPNANNNNQQDATEQQQNTDENAQQDTTEQQQNTEENAQQDTTEQQQNTEENAQQDATDEGEPAPDEGTADETTEGEAETEEGPTATAVNVPQGYSQNDIQLMANAVYGEARGEPYEGQVAVAAVILNRVESPTFPNTVSGVIFEPRAFTAVADGQIWLEPNDKAREAVLDAINGWDPSGGAIYYYNPQTATSSWIFSRPQIKQIGKHIFAN